MLVKHSAVDAASAQKIPEKDEALGIPAPAINIRGAPVTRIHRKAISIPTKKTADMVRDSDAEERKRLAAHIHMDHMKRTVRESRIVNRSMPPSRKLIVMNGTPSSGKS